MTIINDQPVLHALHTELESWVDSIVLYFARPPSQKHWHFAPCALAAWRRARPPLHYGLLSDASLRTQSIASDSIITRLHHHQEAISPPVAGHTSVWTKPAKRELTGINLWTTPTTAEPRDSSSAVIHLAPGGLVWICFPVITAKKKEI